MKIICVGRNYSEHAKELGNTVPDAPVVFMKPQTALLKDDKPFYYPDWSNDIHYEAELVLKVCKQGKYIDEKFASKYYDAVTVGIDLTARDLQERQKEKKLPWEIAKAFDGSAVVNRFFQLEELGKSKDFDFHLLQNGREVQRGHSSRMIFTPEKIIAYVSQFFTLQKGDLLFTGTPAGVGPVQRGDVLEAFLEGRQTLRCEVK